MAVSRGPVELHPVWTSAGAPPYLSIVRASLVHPSIADYRECHGERILDLAPSLLLLRRRHLVGGSRSHVWNIWRVRDLAPFCLRDQDTGVIEQETD